MTDRQGKTGQSKDGAHCRGEITRERVLDAATVALAERGLFDAITFAQIAARGRCDLGVVGFQTGATKQAAFPDRFWNAGRNLECAAWCPDCPLESHRRG